MTPPPAATAAGRRSQPPTRSRTVQRPDRVRVSRAAPSQPAARALGPAVALPRLPQISLPRPSLRGLPLAVGRLFSGRRVIPVLGVMLLGLVAMQVVLLRLNTAISVNVERAAQLERDNAQARATVSKLDAGRRIEDAAGKLGMVMPAAGSICFLSAERAGRCSGGDAAQAGSGLDPAADLAPAAGTAPAGAATTGAATQATGTTPAAGTAAPSTGAAPATGTAPASAQTAPAAGTTAPATGTASPTGATAPATGTSAPAQAQAAPVTGTAPATGTTGGLAAGG